MANVKNFGLIGVGTTLQLGKAGITLVNDASKFKFTAADGTTEVAIKSAGITSSSGNVTLTTGNVVATAGDLVATAGNVVLSANSGVVTLGDAGDIGRAATGVYSFSGTGAIIVPSGTALQQTAVTAGSFRYNSETLLMEFANGTTWTPVGNTAPLQTEINNIETSLGAGIDSSGNFVAGGFSGPIVTATSFTNAINQLGAYALAHDTLDEIFAPGTLGNVIYSDGTNWQKALPGVTSGVQAYDAGLTALAAKSSTGILVQTGADTYASRTLVAPAAGFTITDADGIAGNPTFALANDLAALEGLATTGYIVRTGDGTATTRSIVGTAGNVVVTNGDGISSDTSINLGTVTQATSGNFVKVTLDTFGRVTGNTAVVAADITALVGAIYVDVAGDTMTGNLVMSGGSTVTGLPDPVAASDAANKAYVDATAAGLTWKTAVLATTTANITLSGAQTIDDVSVVAGNRVLVKNQSTAADNGIYVAAAGAWTRSTDADSPSELDSAAVFVQQGTVGADTGWTQTATIVTVGTTAQTWVQFSGANAYIGGTGIDITGNTISVNLGAGIGEFNTDNVGIDLFDAATGALILTTNGTARSTSNAGQLQLLLDGAGALAQTSSGLKVNAASVTNAMLVNNSFVTNADAGSNGSLALGGELEIKGTSTQGITTAIAGSVFTISASDASDTQKGVATFNTASFAVTAGDVTIKTAGVSNTQLANSIVTFTGTTGSDAVALGESMAIIGDGSMITTAMGSNSLAITLGTVDVPHGGTGALEFAANEILFGAGTSPLATSPDFKFTPGATIDTLSIGGASGLTLTTNSAASDVILTALGTDGDIVAVPNGTGSFIVGATGAGLIQSDAGQALTVRGNTTLTLTSGTGSTSMVLVAGTGQKVNISGPSAIDYATSLGANSLTNKQYVDNAIASGASAGSIKAVSATVSLAAAASLNIGAVLPAGATILSVKVKVTAADTVSGTLVVGKSGGSEYMAASENDTQTVGMYIAEDMVTEAGAVQVQATIAGTPGGSGSATIVVTYQVAAV